MDFNTSKTKIILKIIQAGCLIDSYSNNNVRIIIAGINYSQLDNLQTMEQSASHIRNRNLSSLQLKTVKVIDNRFQIKDQCLGKGTYGKVFVCWDKQNQKTVAVKEISKLLLLQKINNSKNKGKSKEFYIKSLRNQAKLLQKLNHQNVLRMYGRSQTENFIYFYLQYCNQQSLHQLLRIHNNLHYEVAIPLMKKILKGCAYLHSLNISHRDLKPQNILFSDGEPKISDFGFAIRLNQDEQVSSFSQFRVGTDLYMAPEAFQMQILTLKSDVWSLGIIFYRMLTGRFPLETIQMSRKKCMLRRELWFADDICIPIFLKTVIQKMLEYNYKLRPSIQTIQAYLNV